MIMATAIAASTVTSVAVPAEARHRRHGYYSYSSRTHYVRKYCRHSSGTTGLIAGGAAGALLGRGLIGGGLAGTLVGAAGGALAGRAIDRSATASRRCYYR
ncbi:hypothetical protein HMF7854_14535 [Sphingomonas ginkgonis]|uniref:17 kDa surface antigen n=2 Tax=Sphingomonas ginkgonis TaxID=2315330 RepID=A0A429VEA5_9SPHN|nr:hypothetical protein HMF7854_14535 [Sphingomonas ginkgonis]